MYFSCINQDSLDYTVVKSNIKNLVNFTNKSLFLPHRIFPKQVSKEALLIIATLHPKLMKTLQATILIITNLTYFPSLKQSGHPLICI